MEKILSLIKENKNITQEELFQKNRIKRKGRGVEFKKYEARRIN
ncbi:MAG: hypothetical protein V1825_04570 [Candidatus Falkowbacteria bacterium]